MGARSKEMTQKEGVLKGKRRKAGGSDETRSHKIAASRQTKRKKPQFGQKRSWEGKRGQAE